MGDKIKVIGQGIDYVMVEVEQPDGSMRDMELSIEEANDILIDLSKSLNMVKKDVENHYNKITKLIK